VVTDPTRMCELLVGLPDVTVLGTDDEAGAPLSIHVETRARRRGCSECGALARVKDRPVVALVDLAAFGRPTRLVWHKLRWLCAEETCPGGSWTEDERRIAAKRLRLLDRAGRWVTEQVGRHARTVDEIAVELGCDWHTINDTVVAYGTALVEHKDRFGKVEALGLDEVLFARVGQWHRQEFTTQIVDMNAGQPLDVGPGRSGDKPKEWLEAKGKEWRDNVQ
jgi:transposase